MFKVLIVLLLLAILVSLGFAMVYVIRDRGHTNRPVRALTIRISLSLALFAMLLIGYFTGAISPHGIYPIQHQPAESISIQNQ